MPRLGSIQDLENYRQSLLLERDPNKLSVNICVDTGCSALGAEQLYGTFKKSWRLGGLTKRSISSPRAAPVFASAARWWSSIRTIFFISRLMNPT